MKYSFMICLAFLFACDSNQSTSDQKTTVEQPWISLFDGQSLENWLISDNQESVRVEDGSIVVNGTRAHAFYNGEVQNHDFKNFEFKAQVMTTPGSNSGIYFHTEYQPEGWPAKGYEVQVNNSQSDWKRTGSLYNVLDVKEVYVQDNEWYTEYIRVEGKRVIVKINDIVVVDYTEPENPLREEGSQRLIDKGTFALQAHDPDSKVYYKDIMVRPLP
ncbi:MAG: DUF1080 domain-containing protein [Saprospiraceae bacterium]|nr:DUF1080 domain-containing protein [Saprospiraceae bacterium]